MDDYSLDVRVVSGHFGEITSGAPVDFFLVHHFIILDTNKCR